VVVGIETQAGPVGGGADRRRLPGVCDQGGHLGTPPADLERTRHLLRLRFTLRESSPAALLAFGEDQSSADALELLGAAPDPVSAARLSTEATAWPMTADEDQKLGLDR
jgi:hypothetical protein